MYRIKYLFGIFSGIFAALYLLFGIVGYDNARTFWDQWTAFILCVIHGVAAAFLLLSSLRDKRKHEKRLTEIISALLLVHPTITAELLAQEANMSVPDAHEYIERTMSKHTSHVSH